ncbi:MAG: serine hydrolase [Ekhidna sp.]|uniref:serine hydrolase domain-containing protein n=1 Tax=Ekhidna sp. TaxID=2608089 RepID=UPI0032EFA945
MRGYLQIVFILICISGYALDTEPNEEVWIDGSSFYKAIKHRKNSTLYFREWAPYARQFLEDEDYFVAIQLDKAFDPLPDDNIDLPNLTTLAAIGEPQLRQDYYGFLESFGRTYGINHMVLPDTISLSLFEKEVIREANKHSPFYFLHKSSLSYSLPDTRREFESEADATPTIWVTAQDESTKKLSKWSDKLDDDERLSFYTRLRAAKLVEFIPAFELPPSLTNSIFTASTIAIDPHERFPLQDHRISYIGTDQPLKRRLSQYTTVLGYRVSGVPCIVDLRNEKEKVMEGDIVIGYEPQNSDVTTLLLPKLEIADQDVLVGKMLFGANGIKGRSSLKGARQIRNYGYLGYAGPEWSGLDSYHLQWIDSLANDAIKKFATPGMQVAVVKNGSVVLEKEYGHFTYDSLQPVSKKTIYDIASVTKVVATLPAIALLVDQEKIHLDDSLSSYLKEFSKSNKSQVTIRQLLAHNAGLLSYVPFWSMMMDGDRLDAFYYKTPEDEAKDIRTYGLEPDPIMLDSLKSFIVRSKLIKNPSEYNYSDLGFMILHLLVERVSGVPFDQFVIENFYQPMGLKHTAFNPIRNGISPRDIAPTEYDQRYRNYQVWGEVHDRNALVFGGVAGHAGLFSTALDMAKMMSMFLNDGYYGGRQYISKETLDQFNFRYFENNRRGLAWDKKDGKKDSASRLASDQSFGHTGFTGTMVWADPEEDLIYVFLSNRIYPDANNWKLGELNTRTTIHDVIYQSIRSVN